MCDSTDKKTETSDVAFEEETLKELEKQNFIFKTFFPVAKSEFFLFFHAACISCVLFFIHSAFKALKNATVSDGIDPAAIPWIKLLFVMPANIYITLYAQKLVLNNGVSKVFSMFLASSSLIFVIYSFVFKFLNFNFFIPKYFVSDLYADDRLKFCNLHFTYPLFGMLISTSSVLYYLMSELFGSLINTYMFWAYTNSFLTRNQALRFSPLFMISSQIGLLSSSIALKRYLSYYETAPFFQRKYLNIFFPIFMATITFLVFLQKKFYEKTVLIKIQKGDGKIKKHKKISLSEAFEITFKSKLAIAISIAVLIYNFGAVVIESYSIKSTKKYSDICEKAAFEVVSNSDTTNQAFISIFTILIVLIPFSKFSSGSFFLIYMLIPWTNSILASVAVPLFTFINYRKILEETSLKNGLWGNELISLKVESYLGRICYIMNKIGKNAGFDLFKEILSMRMNSKYRALLKGAYDGHFGKIGKGAGSLFIIFMNMISDNDLRSCGFNTFLVFCVANLLWACCIYYLQKSYLKSVVNNTDMDYDWLGGEPFFD